MFQKFQDFVNENKRPLLALATVGALFFFGALTLPVLLVSSSLVIGVTFLERRYQLFTNLLNSVANRIPFIKNYLAKLYKIEKEHKNDPDGGLDDVFEEVLDDIGEKLGANKIPGFDAAAAAAADKAAGVAKDAKKAAENTDLGRKGVDLLDELEDVVHDEVTDATAEEKRKNREELLNKAGAELINLNTGEPIVSKILDAASGVILDAVDGDKNNPKAENKLIGALLDGGAQIVEDRLANKVRPEIIEGAKEIVKEMLEGTASPLIPKATKSPVPSDNEGTSPSSPKLTGTPVDKDAVIAALESHIDVSDKEEALKTPIIPKPETVDSHADKTEFEEGQHSEAMNELEVPMRKPVDDEVSLDSGVEQDTSEQRMEELEEPSSHDEFVEVLSETEQNVPHAEPAAGSTPMNNPATGNIMSVLQDIFDQRQRDAALKEGNGPQAGPSNSEMRPLI